MLHGGLGYLENLKFRLIKEALQKRDLRVNIAPHFSQRLQLRLIACKQSLRSSWVYAFGLKYQELLAMKS